MITNITASFITVRTFIYTDAQTCVDEDIYLALTHMIRLSFADALLYRSTWEITMAPLICPADWTLHLSINIEAKLIL